MRNDAGSLRVFDVGIETRRPRAAGLGKTRRRTVNAPELPSRGVLVEWLRLPRGPLFPPVRCLLAFPRLVSRPLEPGEGWWV